MKKTIKATPSKKDVVKEIAIKVKKEKTIEGKKKVLIEETNKYIFKACSNCGKKMRVKK